MAAAVAYAEAHYHNTINSIGRGTGGAPVVAKAAYRAGECLYDERTQQWFDYSYKADRVIEKFIMLPEGAAAWGYDRNRLWNASETAEPRKNGRNATELELALPHVLSDEQRHDMLSAYVRQKVEKFGIAADVAMHFGRDGNIHAHVMLSHREFGAAGFGEVCNARTVMKKRKGEWKKETVYGISANPDAVKELRREWADHQNAWFEKLGLDIRVDHRSFEERGIKETPTVHLGPAAAALEARGVHTDRGDINRMIEVGNAEVRRLEAEKQRHEAEIIDLQARRAEREAHQDFGVARSRVTEPGVFERDAADAAWIKAVEAAGIAADSSPHLEHRSDPETVELRESTARRERETAREAVQGRESTAAPTPPGKENARTGGPENRREEHSKPRSDEAEKNSSKRKAGPWMQQSGGLDELSFVQRFKAARSYRKWAQRNPAAAARYDLTNYVEYVQQKWEAEGRAAEPGPAAKRTVAATVAANPAYRETGKVERATEKAAGRGSGIAGRTLISVFAGLAKWLDLFPATPPSPEQQERNYWAAKEQEATDQINRRKKITGDELRAQMARDDQERARQRRERGRDIDDYGRER